MSHTIPDLPLAPLQFPIPPHSPQNLKSFRLGIGIKFRRNGLVAVAFLKECYMESCEGIARQKDASAYAKAKGADQTVPWQRVGVWRSS